MKGQITIESLVTYAWAIVIATTIIFMMWQLGITSPNTWMGKHYSGFAMFEIHDFKISSGNLTIFASTLAKNRINEVNFTTEGKWVYVSEITPGEIKQITITGLDLNSGERYNLAIKISYKSANNSYSDAGIIAGQVEED